MYDEDGKPLTELELLKMKMNKTTDESVESTRRMVQLCDESQRVGAATMEQLASQGDQLRDIDQNMDVIHSDLRDAERDLEQLDKCCGLCVLPWKKSKKLKTENVFDSQRSGKIRDSRPTSGTPNTKQPQNQPVPGQPCVAGQNQYVTRITNDAREDEMEANLGQVAGMVGDLRSMATDMNKEIQYHNQLLENIDKKTVGNQERMNEAQRRADTLVGKQSKPATSPTSANMGLAAAKYLAK